MDEEGFQRTMRYIFTFIEKVASPSHTRARQSTDAYIINRKNKQRVSSKSSASASD
jgi:hypothetical protein